LNHTLKRKKELEIECTLRPNQLTIEFINDKNISNTKETIIRIIKSNNEQNIDILESSHSMDIIPSGISKTNVLDPLRTILKNKKLPTDLLCIGDKGVWPGNDFRLLDTEHSLSVYEVNNSKQTCWNIAPIGIKHTDATLQYLDWLKFEPSRMKIKILK
jgi:hydroxymethylpyrimidine pyrophosphatase-like HAD family hydrolase